jgi:hypothetical protein
MHVRNPVLPLSTCQRKTLCGKNEQKGNVNIVGLPIGLAPFQGVSDTIINLREQGLDWVLEVIWVGRLGVAICKLSRVNPSLSMNDVLDQFSDCDPSVAQKIVFQG